MAKRIMAFTERAAAHAALETERSGAHPNAECREDPNSEAPYEVWDGPEEWVMPAPPEPPDPAAVLAAEEAALDRLAEKLLARLREGGA